MEEISSRVLCNWDMVALRDKFVAQQWTLFLVSIFFGGRGERESVVGAT